MTSATLPRVIRTLSSSMGSSISSAALARLITTFSSSLGFSRSVPNEARNARRTNDTGERGKRMAEVYRLIGRRGIGRAEGRERGCRYVEVRVVGVQIKKK